MVSQYSGILSPIAVDAVMRVVNPAVANNVDLNDIKIVKKIGLVLSYYHFRLKGIGTSRNSFSCIFNANWLLLEVFIKKSHFCVSFGPPVVGWLRALDQLLLWIQTVPRQNVQQAFLHTSIQVVYPGYSLFAQLGEKSFL